MNFIRIGNSIINADIIHAIRPMNPGDHTSVVIYVKPGSLKNDHHDDVNTVSITIANEDLINKLDQILRLRHFQNDYYNKDR